MSCCYIIKCKCDKIYVGSTNRDCNKREREHNSECFNPKRRSYYSPVYSHFRNCGLERNDLKCIKMFDCSSQERLVKENKWIKLIGSLNTICSIEDLDKIKIRKERYKQEGKIQHKCMCGRFWTHNHKQRHYKTIVHQQYIQEENEKKIKYLQILNAKKNEEITKNIPIHYDQEKKCFIKEE